MPHLFPQSPPLHANFPPDGHRAKHQITVKIVNLPREHRAVDRTAFSWSVWMQPGWELQEAVIGSTTAETLTVLQELMFRLQSCYLGLQFCPPVLQLFALHCAQEIRSPNTKR